MLTEPQSKALRFIVRHQRENNGVTPTYRAIAATLGLKSTNSSHRLVLALEERGCIRRLPRKAQAIQVLPMGHLLLRESADAAA